MSVIYTYIIAFSSGGGNTGMPNGYPKFSMFWIQLFILSSTFALLSALFLLCLLHLQITSMFWLFSPRSLLPTWLQLSSSLALTSAIAATKSLCISLAPPIFFQLRSSFDLKIFWTFCSKLWTFCSKLSSDYLSHSNTNILSLLFLICSRCLLVLFLLHWHLCLSLKMWEMLSPQNLCAYWVPWMGIFSVGSTWLTLHPVWGLGSTVGTSLAVLVKLHPSPPSLLHVLSMCHYLTYSIYYSLILSLPGECKLH